MNKNSILSLKEALNSARPLYMLPEEPLLEEVLIPATKNSLSLDIMVGYFSSGSFSEIAPGLATFLKNSEGTMQLVICPVITEDDYNIISLNQNDLANYSKKILIDEIPDEDKIANYTLECLAWLIHQERLIIKIALMKNGGIYHPKCWLFEDKHNSAALHGSSNATLRGLTKNTEQLALSRDWMGGIDATEICKKLRRKFNDIWSLKDKNLHVFDLSEAVSKNILVKFKLEQMPNEQNLKLLQQGILSKLNSKTDLDLSRKELKIPAHLVYESGEFKHQGDAVSAWENKNRMGILAMATGSGKTITAMICATKLQNELKEGLLVVISAPYKPLIAQWCEEISDFGIQAINLTESGNSSKRSKEIMIAGRNLSMDISRTEVLVTSNDTLCTDQFIESITRVKSKKLIIADECHNLGSESFTTNPPIIFDYRLGLSATPIRQYDEKGTEELLAFFGQVCFNYDLKEAIGKCLTEYDYHVHFVELLTDEMEEWRDLTEEISANQWRRRAEKDVKYLELLVIKRRKILETASGKISLLAELLELEGNRKIEYALIYATDKDPQQLKEVNKLLKDRGISFHQLTDRETNKGRTAQEILLDFQNCHLKVLTAKRVLDEGVNIPQIKLAFLLASTTVIRQWVQRRGRLLRKCKEIGKTHAVIHDFVVLPPNVLLESSTSQDLDEDSRKLIRSEYKRVWEFAKLSRNSSNDDGPFKILDKLKKLTNQLE
jgi:superfamily II DNA or RNA helicase